MRCFSALTSMGAALAVMALAATAQAEPRVERSVPVAPGVYEVVFNPANDDVYVAAVGPRGQNQARIIQIDGATLERVGEIDVAASPLYGLGIDTRAQVLFGTDTRAGTVSAIDLATGAVTAFGPGEGAHVRQVVVDEATGRAYVSVVGGNPRQEDPAPSAVWVVEDNAVTRIIELDVAQLTGIELDAAHGRIFGAAMGAAEVVVVDLESGEITQRFPAGAERPTNLVYDAEGGRLFVANQGGGNLTVLNAETGELLATVATGEGALSVAYNPGNHQVYVANRQAGTVTVVDARTYEVIANLETGTFPQTIAIDPGTGRVYVTNKARGLPRGAPAGTPVPEDPNGDTLTVIVP